jgi:hypothetical protein
MALCLSLTNAALLVPEFTHKLRFSHHVKVLTVQIAIKVASSLV